MELMVHICDPISEEAEAGGLLQSLAQPEIYSKALPQKNKKINK